MMQTIILVVAAALSTASLQAQEATSLLGKPLLRAEQPADARAKLEANLRAAEEEFAKTPTADALIWVGRRTAYLGRFRDAIAVFTRGVQKFPDDARMYRHRGHRYITVREFDKAIADLSTAAALVSGKPDQVEPDGQPNARNTPTGTLNSNIYYHLGLAYYLKGDFARALTAYRRCLDFSKNPDMLAATTHWLYMTLRRLGRDDDARAALQPIAAGMDIIENASYYKLLLMYKGDGSADALLDAARAGGLDGATIGYGVGNWHLYNGRRDTAMQIFRDIVEKSAAQWPAFGYVASEAELARARR
jgi:tetratricopeptide (TPR) repeat protein